ncbi:hypothetical protein C1646_774144, partial [Rhizophagus diaphanus]
MNTNNSSPNNFSNNVHESNLQPIIATQAYDTYDSYTQQSMLNNNANVASPNHNHQQQYQYIHQPNIPNSTVTITPDHNHHHNYHQPMSNNNATISTDNNHHVSNNISYNNNQQQSTSNNVSPPQQNQPSDSSQSNILPLLNSFDYNLFLQQNTIHDRWHTRLNNNITQVQYYHRDLSCPHCYPPGPNTPQFVNFWDWYSTENPTESYTSNTQQALEDLSDAPTIRDLWEAIYSLVFTVRYTDIPQDPGLLYTDEDLHLENLFEEPEEPDMAMAGGGPNANQLLNAINVLTNALGVGGNNMQNVNNALNNLNAAVTANNNAMQNRGMQAAAVPTFYGGNQNPITWLNEFNNACAANGWNAAQKLQIVPAYLKGVAATWWQTVVNNPINVWDGAVNNNTFEHQQPNETVDQYAAAIRELYQRINTPVFAYPDNVQAWKFVSGLLPELYMAVKPFGDQTLTDAINRTKACELTLNFRKTRLLNYAQTNRTEVTELAQLVSVLVQQVSDLGKKIDSRPVSNYRKPPAAKPELSVQDRPPIR